MQDIVTLEVTFLLRAELVYVTTATGVSKCSAHSSLFIEIEAVKGSPAVPGSFRLHARRSRIAFID